MCIMYEKKIVSKYRNAYYKQKKKLKAGFLSSLDYNRA